MKDEYRAKVIQEIINKGDKTGFYGILTSRIAGVKKINIDRAELELLLEYYKLH